MNLQAQRIKKICSTLVTETETKMTTTGPPFIKVIDPKQKEKG